jgi:hypothetical protein
MPPVGIDLTTIVLRFTLACVSPEKIVLSLSIHTLCVCTYPKLFIDFYYKHCSSQILCSIYP